MIKKPQSSLKAMKFWDRLSQGAKLHSEELISSQQQILFAHNLLLLDSPTSKPTRYFILHLSCFSPFVFKIRKCSCALNSGFGIRRLSTNPLDHPTSK
jgi:hypothetical protein